jgi:hypothetical protein
MKKAWYCVLILMLSSCSAAAPGRLDTPNGNPQVTINRDAKVVRTAILEWLLNNGFMIDPASGNDGIAIAGITTELPWAQADQTVRLTFDLMAHDTLQTTIFAYKCYVQSTKQTVFLPSTNPGDFLKLQAYLGAIQKNLGGQ